MPFSMISFFRFVMVMTSFDLLLDQCTCFRTRQTAHLSRSSPGVGFHPNLHPNQGFIRVHDIYYCCVNRFYNRTKLYIIAHYLQPSPTSSPVSRTTEPLVNQGVPLLFGTSDPHLTPIGFLRFGCGLGMSHSASKKFCIRSALSLLMVSVTCA